MKFKVLEFGKPTVNGRIYSPEGLQSIRQPLFAFTSDGSGNGDPSSLDDIVGIVTSIEHNQEDNCLWAEIQFTNTPKGPAAKDLTENHRFQFITFGLGMFKQDSREVESFQLLGLSLIPPEDKANG